jgi:hypothetical protein
MKIKNLSSTPIYLLMFLGPLSTTFIDKLNILLIVGLCVCFFVFTFLKDKKVNISHCTCLLILPYFFVIFLGYIRAIFNSEILPPDYFFQLLSGRLFTVMVCFFFMLSFAIWVESVPQEKRETSLKFGLYTTIMFLLFAIWQYISFKTSIPFLVESRTKMHGVGGVLKALIPERITSIAREPNFYSPILIESMILARLLLKPKQFSIFLMITLIILLLTFSGGVYVHFCLFAMFFIFQRKGIPLKTKAYVVMFILLCSLSLFYFFKDLIFILFDFVVAKAETESTGGSSRMKVFLYIFEGWWNSDTLDFLFGHGIASLGYASELTNTASVLDFTITNNFYLDFLWEAGLVGLVIIMLPWLLFFYILWRRRIQNIYFESATLLMFSFYITCLYRSEYVTTHFAWVISLIIVLYKMGVDSHKKRYQLK